MKIVHVCSSDFGGAGIAALRLHLALCSEGCDSRMLCLNKNSSYETVIQYQKSILSRVLEHSNLPLGQNKYRSFVNDNGHYECTSFPDAFFDISDHRLVREADIINLHWVGNMLNYYKFFSKIKKNIVWTLHDINPFMGCCHTLLDYENNPDNMNFEMRLQAYKRKAIQQSKKINVVCLCEWMKSHSIHSSTFSDYPHYVIPNSVDTSLFCLRNKKACRNVLGLPDNRPIILFVSQAISNYRKGFDILLEALAFIKCDCVFLAIGAQPKGQNKHSNITFLGNIHDQLLMSIIYNAADLFILPSREDNLPNTMLESLCCGTPVVAFSNGGMKEYIIDYENGFIVPTMASEALGDTINHLISSGCMLENRLLIERKAHSIFRYKHQADKYLSLYQSLVQSRG